MWLQPLVCRGRSLPWPAPWSGRDTREPGCGDGGTGGHEARYQDEENQLHSEIRTLIKKLSFSSLYSLKLGSLLAP